MASMCHLKCVGPYGVQVSPKMDMTIDIIVTQVCKLGNHVLCFLPSLTACCIIGSSPGSALLALLLMSLHLFSRLNHGSSDGYVQFC